jgi:hypothetical protein
LVRGSAVARSGRIFLCQHCGSSAGRGVLAFHGGRIPHGALSLSRRAHIFNPTLGVLLSIAFWLYILGELYFGRMAEVMRKASQPMQMGYFWIRLIMTVGWAVIPILYFVDVVIGVGYGPVVATLYTIADLVNLIALALTYLAVAGKERY